MSETYMTMIMKYVKFGYRKIVKHVCWIFWQFVSAKHFNKCKVLGKKSTDLVNTIWKCPNDTDIKAQLK